MPAGRSQRTPFLAAVGLRVEPAPPGTGLAFSTGIETGRLPMAFINAVTDAVRDTLRQGLSGWEIPDCSVTMTSSGYWPRQSHAHCRGQPMAQSAACAGVEGFALQHGQIIMHGAATARCFLDDDAVCGPQRGDLLQ